MNKTDDLSRTRRLKISLLFWLPVLAVVVSAWAVRLSPAPYITLLPAWSDALISRLSWSAGGLFFALMCLTKTGRRSVKESSGGKLTKQIFLIFTMPLMVAFFTMFTTQAVIAGLGGVYVSLRGEPQVVTGEVIAKTYTTSRGCRYRAEIRWSSSSQPERHCYSEALWTQIEVGHTVSQQRWQWGNIYAESHFAWPKKEIPTEVKRAEISNAWGGFVFFGTVFFLPLVSVFLFWLFAISRPSANS